MVTPWKITLAAVALFASGVVTGGFVAGMSVRKGKPPFSNLPLVNSSPRSPSTRSNSASLKPPGWQRLEGLERLESELDLTSAQRDRVRIILADSRERIRVAWEPVAPQVRAEIRRARDEINRELRPDQRHQAEVILGHKTNEVRRERSRKEPAKP